MSDQSVLPSNSSLLEKGIEKAFRELLYAGGNPFPDLLNPNTTPDHLVPYVAQDRGVDDWYSEDTIANKRKLASSIWTVRRRAGTRAGIKDSVRSLGVEAEFVKKGAYKFGLIVRATEEPTLSDTVGRIVARVETAKSERSIFDVTLAMESQVGMAQSFVMTGTTEVTGSASGRSRLSADLTRVMVANAGAVVTASNKLSGRSILRAYRYGGMMGAMSVAHFEGVIS
mgnify:CR=1 FL=1